MLNLKELAALEGWQLVETPEPSEHPGRLGTPQTDPLCYAQACAGNVLAVKPNHDGHAFYAAAHEIAEARHDFSGHEQHVWREQCNIMARWCRHLWRAQQGTPIGAFSEPSSKPTAEVDLGLTMMFTP